MTSHAERMAALVAALAKVPPDERDQWGEYPAHNDAAYDLGIRTNGSAPGEICNLRLGMLGDSGPTLALAAEGMKLIRDYYERKKAEWIEAVTKEYSAEYARKHFRDYEIGMAGFGELLAQWEEGT